MKEIILKNLNELKDEYHFSEDTHFKVLVKPAESISKPILVDFYHEKPDLKTRIDFKIVAKDIDIALEVTVRIRDTNKNTDTFLKLHALNLSPKNKITLIPSMEIANKDVSAGHGAVIGGLDKLSLHYLKSRGLNDSEATNLIIESFLN